MLTNPKLVYVPVKIDVQATWRRFGWIPHAEKK